MEERRELPRVRTLKAGKIVLNLHGSVVDCKIRNLNSKGALLIVPSLVGIPETFELVLEPNDKRQDCRVKWRGQDRLGVEFSKPGFAATRFD